MKLRLDGYRKVQHDDNKAVFKNDKGHELHIAVKSLSPKFRTELSNLPLHAEKPKMMADGGEVADKEEILPPVPASMQRREVSEEPKTELQNSIDQAANQEQSDSQPYGTSEAVLPQSQPSQGLAQPQMQGPAPASAPQDQGAQPPQGGFPQSGIQSQIQGIQNEAQAQGALGKEQAAINHQQAQAQQQELDRTQAIHGHIQGEMDSLAQDIKDHPVVAKGMFDDKNLGQKIGTSIGLLLGGLSSGLTGKDNPALTYIQGQIDRDLKAQQLNHENKQNLYGAYLREYNNASDASAMTRLAMNNIALNQLQEAAAKAQDPIAKARALQTLGPLQQSMAQMQWAFSQNKAKEMQGGDPSKLLFAIPPADRPAYTKELGEAQNTTAAKDNILNAFDKVAKLQTIASRVGSPFQAGSQLAALKDPITAAISKGTAGRFTEADAKMLETLWPNVKDNAETVALKKEQLNKMVSEKMHFPELEKWGVNPQSMSTYKPAHPNEGKTAVNKQGQRIVMKNGQWVSAQ